MLRDDLIIITEVLALQQARDDGLKVIIRESGELIDGFQVHPFRLIPHQMKSEKVNVMFNEIKFGPMTFQILNTQIPQRKRTWTRFELQIIIFFSIAYVSQALVIETLYVLVKQLTALLGAIEAYYHTQATQYELHMKRDLLCCTQVKNTTLKTLVEFFMRQDRPSRFTEQS